MRTYAEPHSSLLDERALSLELGAALASTHTGLEQLVECAVKAQVHRKAHRMTGHKPPIVVECCEEN
jgi:hypothetical protein